MPNASLVGLGFTGLTWLMLVGCSSSVGARDASVQDMVLVDASRGDLAKKGTNLYETFCAGELAATYMRCYIAEPPNNGY